MLELFITIWVCQSLSKIHQFLWYRMTQNSRDGYKYSSGKGYHDNLWHKQNIGVFFYHRRSIARRSSFIILTRKTCDMTQCVIEFSQDIDTEILYSVKCNNHKCNNLKSIQRTSEEPARSHISKTCTVMEFPHTLAVLVTSKTEIYKINLLDSRYLAQFFSLNKFFW